MIGIDEYKKNPCRVSAIPYWKIRTYKTPNNKSVIHDEHYNIDTDIFSADTLYFRLKHNLKSVGLEKMDNMFEYRNVDINNNDDLNEVVNIINNCYADIQVDIKQVIQWTKAEVFNKNLWVFIIEIDKQKPVALGIAELDREVREGALEWIQVLPEYRKRKLGQALVSKLLVSLRDNADFVTVSGQVNNRTNPENLYRNCGFEGNDIWHVLVKK